MVTVVTLEPGEPLREVAAAQVPTQLVCDVRRQVASRLLRGRHQNVKLLGHNPMEQVASNTSPLHTERGTKTRWIG